MEQYHTVPADDVAVNSAIREHNSCFNEVEELSFDITVINECLPQSVEF